MFSRRTLARTFFFQAEDGIRDYKVTGVQTCALPISRHIFWSLLPNIGSPVAGSIEPPDPRRLSKITSRSLLFVGQITRTRSSVAGSKIGRASCRERV